MEQNPCDRIDLDRKLTFQFSKKSFPYPIRRCSNRSPTPTSPRGPTGRVDRVGESKG